MQFNNIIVVLCRNLTQLVTELEDGSISMNASQQQAAGDGCISSEFIQAAAELSKQFKRLGTNQHIKTGKVLSKPKWQIRSRDKNQKPGANEKNLINRTGNIRLGTIWEGKEQHIPHRVKGETKVSIVCRGNCEQVQ